MSRWWYSFAIHMRSRLMNFASLDGSFPTLLLQFFGVWQPSIQSDNPQSRSMFTSWTFERLHNELSHGVWHFLVAERSVAFSLTPILWLWNVPTQSRMIFRCGTVAFMSSTKMFRKCLCLAVTDSSLWINDSLSIARCTPILLSTTTTGNTGYRNTYR